MVLIELIRVKHWVKNLFLFIPIFFAGQLMEWGKYQQLLLGFVAFSLVASMVYIVNDLRDYSFDKAHPVKMNRPIASGRIKPGKAIFIAILFIAIGFSLAWYIHFSFFILLLCYLLLNLAYSFGLKNFSIIDIMIVSSGFLVRIYCGGVLADVPVSHWLAIMILLLALFLALAKRRDDLLVGASKGSIRKSINQYNLEFINVCLSIFAGVIIVSYILYTLSPEVIEKFNTDWLFLTSIFVIAGIMRYLQIIYIDNNSGFPTSLLFKDRFILFTVIAWLISFCIVIYT
ncbi:MAG: UbiA prenyltransferase family protein [Cyclobacteriaceae bacterium]|nr:UbiA prenyltransferase family protein [Cyclobacteriaceae bacterium]